MKKDANKFTLWTDSNGNELHLTKSPNGWICDELAKAKADLEGLLAMIADATHEIDYAKVEAIGKRNGFAFDEAGQVIRSS